MSLDHRQDLYKRFGIEARRHGHPPAVAHDNLDRGWTCRRSGHHAQRGKRRARARLLVLGSLAVSGLRPGISLPVRHVDRPSRIDVIAMPVVVTTLLFVAIACPDVLAHRLSGIAPLQFASLREELMLLDLLLFTKRTHRHPTTLKTRRDLTPVTFLLQIPFAHRWSPRFVPHPRPRPHATSTIRE